MGRHVTVLCLILHLMYSSAQITGVDTLYKANDLIYFSNLERTIFTDFLEGEPDYLAMISAVDPNTEERELQLYREWMDEIINDIQDKKFDQLSEKKKIERIKKHVSKSLLGTYKYDAGFNDLFRFGSYNYFTVTAIYLLILDQLRIPYKIHELPTHLYLVAYPDDLDIRFETTVPGHQFFMFDHDTRSNFVDFIHRQGVIDDSIYKNTSIKVLFQQYYFADYGLSMREMVSLFYLNSAVDFLVKELTHDSYSQLEKAFILHPSCKSQFILLSQLNGFLVEKDYHNPLYLGYLIKASRLINFGISRESIDDYLLDIVKKVLVQDEDQDGFEFIFEYLQEYLHDEELKNNFRFYYLSESGRMEFNETRYASALEYFEPAYLMQPENKRVRDLLTLSLSGYSLMVSPNLLLEKIHQYDSSFSAISDEAIYKMIKIQTYLSLFGEAFQLQDGHTGEYYMAEFEKLMDENPDLGSDYIIIGRSYSSAAIYYYRKGRIKKSRQVLEKGLSYAPDNIGLKLKLSSFK